MLSKFFKKIFFLYQIIFDNKLYYKLAKSQNKNKENLFLKKISSKFDFKYFIEIGFHNTEFNCLGLIEKNFSGLLIDSGRWINVFIMRLIIKILKKDIQVMYFHIEKKNVKKIFNNRKKIGCLSIDIDGNDFWMVKKILELNIKPEVFIVEYNPSFLNFSYSSLYDKKFDRFKKHPSGLYHGASLISFVKLFNKYDFCLVKIIGGINAFFLQKRLLKKFRLKALTSKEYREGKIRNNFLKIDAKLQFDIIKKFNFAKI